MLKCYFFSSLTDTMEGVSIAPLFEAMNVPHDKIEQWQRGSLHKIIPYLDCRNPNSAVRGMMQPRPDFLLGKGSEDEEV